jgi:plastocyanin
MAAVLGPLPARAASFTVQLRDCRFAPSLRFVDPGDSITWFYAEGASSVCAGQNHRIKSYSTPAGEGFDSSPSCDSPTSLSSDCMNNTFGESSYDHQFNLPGTYLYYCPFHGTLTSDGGCNGMCGKVVINPIPSNPQSTGPSASPSSSKSPAPSKSASASPSGSLSASASPSPTGTQTLASKSTNERGAGARVAIAIAAVVLLGALGFVVWRAFLSEPR